ncbi:MAG: multidrug transporter, partial [Pelagibacterales bacterium]|nr:multidrug transporter [Pelagibacterales bacterium]
MNLKTAIKVIISFVLISSCSLDPKYKTPEIDLPFSESDKSKKQISLVSWEEFFESPELQKVIKLALENNRDLKISALNIESAWAIHGSQRANLLPNISAVASKTMQKAPSAFAAFTPKQQFRANLVLTSYEIDFFGRLRSLKKSALEDYLATKEANNVLRISLISEVVNSYIQLLADLSNLKYSE